VLSQDVDMVFSITTPASQKVGAVTAGTKIPVVFAPVVDPVGAGLVNSLSRPGGNATGVRVGGFAAKELEWLVTLAPATKRVLVPHNPQDAASVEALSVLREAALKVGAELVVQEAKSPQELDQIFSNFPQDVDAILLVPNNIAISRISDFVRVSHQRRLPLASVAYAQLEAGALMTYGPDFFQAGRQAARLADKVLRGTSPAVLPVETSEYFFSINLLAAQNIGLTIPDEILHQADRVIR
jgi:putative ABC transport system substrate-binding protein